MSLRRDRTPLGGSALPTLEASNQSQIDDLVQRNRTLEHTLRKANEQIEAEKERAKENVAEIRRQWEANQLQWKQGCEELLHSYRTAQKIAEMQVESEKGCVLKEMRVTREEKLARMARDFKITLFMMNEEKLVRRIEELEDAKAMLDEQWQTTLMEVEQEKDNLAASLRKCLTAMRDAQKEIDRQEAKSNKFRESIASLKAQNETLSSKLERTQLQLDGLQTKYKDLEKTNDELERIKADLTRQIAKWENLENKGSEAANSERERRVELERQLREAKEQLDKLSEADRVSSEKEKKKADRFRSILEDWKAKAESHEEEIDNLKKQLAKLQKQNEKLKDDLETERARVRPPSPVQQRATGKSEKSTVRNQIPTTVEDDEDEDPEQEPEEATPKAAKSKPSQNTKKSKVPDDGEPAPSRTARKTTGGKAPRAQKEVEPEPETIASDDEEVVKPVKKRRPPKSKAADTDAETDAPSKPATKRGKRKASPAPSTTSRKPSEAENSDDPDDVEEPPAKKRGASTKPASKATVSAKPASRAASRQPSSSTVASKKKIGDDDDNEEAQVAVRKKRKINMFGVSKPPGGTAAFSLGGDFDAGGLGIPSVLSPLKADEPVPQRSLAGALSSLGAFVTRRT